MSDTEWRQEQKRRAEEFSQARDDWQRRWFLSLAVGNGAGAVGLTSAFVNTLDKKPPPWFLLPGLWFFSVGLILAGFLPILQVLRLKALADHAEVGVYEQQHGHESFVATGDDTLENSATLRFRYSTARKRWDRAVLVVQFCAAIAFGLGVLVPLIMFTFCRASGIPPKH